MLHTDVPKAAQIIFSDLPQKEGEEWVLKMPQHSAASFGSQLTHEGYKDIPVSYLICESDDCVLPEIQRAGIERIEKASGKKVDVASISADHCPLVRGEPLRKTTEWVFGVLKKAESEA